MVGVIARLAADAPLMLVFEDLQWADGPTLDLLALLVARSGRGGCCWCSPPARTSCTARIRSGAWPRAGSSSGSCERLELERLGRREVAAQIEAILGERPDGELVEFVFERSEGIPLFVEELLGAVRDGRVDQDYLPPSLRDVLLARAELLSDNGQHVLRVVSAAARWVPDRLLAPVAGTPGRGAERGHAGGDGAAAAGGRRIRTRLRLPARAGPSRDPRRPAAGRARPAAPGLRRGDRAQRRPRRRPRRELDAGAPLAGRARPPARAAGVGPRRPGGGRGVGAVGRPAPLRARARAVEPGARRRAARRDRSRAAARGRCRRGAAGRRASIARWRWSTRRSTRSASRGRSSDG